MNKKVKKQSENTNFEFVIDISSIVEQTMPETFETTDVVEEIGNGNIEGANEHTEVMFEDIQLSSSVLEEEIEKSLQKETPKQELRIDKTEIVSLSSCINSLENTNDTSSVATNQVNVAAEPEEKQQFRGTDDFKNEEIKQESLEEP